MGVVTICANQKALNQLILGANSLNFDVTQLSEINFSVLLDGIEFDYIHLYFKTNNSIQEKLVTDWFSDKNPLFLHVNNDTNSVNAFGINAIGGNSIQELAYALAKGKDILTQNPNGLVHFTFGIGNNFLLEIAKFRAFHILWDKMKNAFNSSVKTTVTAQTGFVNKSLHDPFTNILRQTTEGLSAVLSGVDQLIIQPYDAFSEQGSSDFTERMAINISLILKEESEINQLIDPFAGSISVENYTQILCDSSWKLFQEFESLSGSQSKETESFLKAEILRIRDKRKEEVRSKKKTLVGINKFSNPDTSKLQWKKEIERFLGLEYLILERDFDSTQSNKI